MEDKQMQVQSGSVLFFHAGFLIISTWRIGFSLICYVSEGVLSAKQVENNSEWLEDWKCSCAAEFYISLPFLTGKKI